MGKRINAAPVALASNPTNASTESVGVNAQNNSKRLGVGVCPPHERTHADIDGLLVHATP